MELAVLNIEGGQTGRKATLSPEVFGLETPNNHAIYLDVKYILANRRQGTHKTKTRGEVKGTSKKMYRQKGTGNARQGSKRSPLHRHGGRIFGPVPHSYDFKLNKKVRLLARQSALTYKAKESAITVVEDPNFDVPKTKRFIAMLNNLQVSNKKVLVVLPVPSDAEMKARKDSAAQGKAVKKEINATYLSGRNVRGVNIVSAAQVNTYDVLNAEVMLVAEGALNYINERLA